MNKSSQSGKMMKMMSTKHEEDNIIEDIDPAGEYEQGEE